MFGGDNTIETIIGLAEQWATQETEAQIDHHQRSIAKLKRQQKFIAGVLASYRKSIAEAEKRAKAQNDLWKKQARNRAKQDAAFYGAPVVTAMPPPPFPKRRAT